MNAHRRNIQDVVAEDMNERSMPKKRENKKEEKVLIGIRIGKEKKEMLHAHFAERGLELGTGIRSVLYDYIKGISK